MSEQGLASADIREMTRKVKEFALPVNEHGCHEVPIQPDSVLGQMLQTDPERAHEIIDYLNREAHRA